MRLAPHLLASFRLISVDHGRTSPVGLPSIVAPDAHAGSGGDRGRRSAISRRMLANSVLGTATSAIWKGDIAAVGHDLRADLDQLLFQAGQRPVLDWLGRRQRAQEVAEVVGERMELKSDRIGDERPARQPRPPDGALALLT
jgi:hypothetical protein